MPSQQDTDVTPTGSEPSEHALVRRVVAGEASAFLALVNRHHASAVRVAAAWGHGAEVAERLARSAWCVLLEGLREGGGGSVRAALLRIASDLARAAAPVPRAQRPGAFTPSGFDDAGRWSRSAATTGGVRGEVLPAALRGAIAALPTWERVVLTLRDVEGLGASEAAAVLGVATAVQHRLLHRARTAVLHHVRTRATA